MGNLVTALANAEFVVGVTDDTANTALATLPPNPIKHEKCLAIAIGEGCYVEDAGTAKPFQTGVTATTVDVRSSATSARFILIVIDLSAFDFMEYDHSAVTT